MLEEFDATVIAIDPAEFDHGLTRNLLAEHARGDILVFLNERSRPCDDELAGAAAARPRRRSQRRRRKQSRRALAPTPTRWPGATANSS